MFFSGVLWATARQLGGCKAVQEVLCKSAVNIVKNCGGRIPDAAETQVI